MTANEKIRCVVIEKTSFLRKIIHGNLTKHGIKDIDMPFSCEEALKSIQGRGSPDLIFVDYDHGSKSMNGLTFIRKLKEHVGVDYEQISVVVISTNFKQIKEQFLQEGVDGFINKPFNFQDFSQVMSAVLRALPNKKNNTSKRITLHDIEALSAFHNNIKVTEQEIHFSFNESTNITINKDIFLKHAKLYALKD